MRDKAKGVLIAQVALDELDQVDQLDVQFGQPYKNNSYPLTLPSHPWVSQAPK
jgi:hypothetical protein